ncbi:hypothetical protein BUB20358_01426 [Burkholderia ubonensis]|nr:hypothetical protein BUB20358_01426 [Burkholderia ubonensis]
MCERLAQQGLTVSSIPENLTSSLPKNLTSDCASGLNAVNCFQNG